MAKEIDQLNFKVILDDKDFNDQIKADIKAAETLNTDVSKLLDLKKKVRQADAAREKSAAAALKEATAEERLALAKQKTATEQARTAKETQRAALAQQKVATEAARTEKAQNQAAAAARRGEQALQGQGRVMREIAGIAAGYLSLRGAGDFLSKLTQISGEYETQKAALSAMLGDAPAAIRILRTTSRNSQTVCRSGWRLSPKRWSRPAPEWSNTASTCGRLQTAPGTTSATG